MTPSSCRIAVLLTLALPFAGCANPSPMIRVPVDVEPADVEAEVYLHERLEGAVQFEPIRAVRTPAAGLLNVQCRMLSTIGDATRGTYSIEFFEASGRRLSSTLSRPWELGPGGYCLIEEQSASTDAVRLILSVR